MLRRAVVLAFACLAMACGDGGNGDDGLTGLSSPTGGPGPTTAAPTDDDAATAATATAADGADDADDDDDDAPPGDDDGDPSTTGSRDDTTTAPGTDDAQTGPPMGTAFGECLGTGAWNTCGQWCNANGASCVADGCDGATVLYYGTVAECTSMRSGDPASLACDAGFAMGGGISFARCCCAF